MVLTTPAGSISVTLYCTVVNEDVTNLLTGVMTAARQSLDNGAKVLLLVGCYRLEAMQQLHVKSHVAWIKEHFSVSIIDREDSVAISETE